MLLQEGHTGRGMPVAHVVQRADLRSWFPKRHFSEGILCWDLPLFPTSSGEPCTKLGITATIEAAAVQVGQPRRSLWIGHSLRVGSVFCGSRSGHMDNPARWLLGVRSCLGFVRGRTSGHVARVGHTCLHVATLGVQLGAVVPSHQGDVLDESVLGFAEEDASWMRARRGCSRPVSRDKLGRVTRRYAWTYYLRHTNRCVNVDSRS